MRVHAAGAAPSTVRVDVRPWLHSPVRVCGALAPSFAQRAEAADSLESRLEFSRVPQGHPSCRTRLLYET